ncbi:hypothetical protein MLD38_006457 [Melastoma candidum]|uniref:Uncharacterized protein n=1 Tax=Melastoma candidum TaxID=119954 RepID=A0ACB9RWE2_9MYRT|nr:hypothetical protein MLD38_006457 [Melastoma candidum]
MSAGGKGRELVFALELVLAWALACLAGNVYGRNTYGNDSSSSIIKSLPGFTGELPFYLETGYIGVGDDEEVQLFYYFVKSQGEPTQDPLLLWVDGGPGCSSFSGFFFESGPLTFDSRNYSGFLPELYLNPFTWIQGINILYMDGPVGAGFSYSKTQEGYYVDDYQFSQQSYEFLRKWLVNHPQYLENELYIGGDSYSGIPIPLLVQLVLTGNKDGDKPTLNLRGYVLGNPVTDSFIDSNAKIPYAHRLSLISDDLYEAANVSCKGDFVNVESNNTPCLLDLKAIDDLTREILLVHILEPDCSNALPVPEDDPASLRRYLKENPDPSENSKLNGPALWCRNYNHMMCSIWANDDTVQAALNVRPGTKKYWQYCNSSLAYTKDVTSVIDYHKNFTKSDLRALIYSGDHDMSIPHMGTQKWINSMNMTLEEKWRAWSVDNQTAGYTKKYKNNDFSLTFVTLKGAGHFAAEYKVTEASAMIGRWIAHYTL